LMVRFSHLVAEQKWIKEIDINPLLASSERLIALDARVLLHDPKTKEEDLPKLAIRPYPAQYISDWKMNDGTEVTLRPIRPEDEPRMVRFHETLSERTVYYRYLEMLQLNQRVAHDRLTRICFIDYDREVVLVADKKDPDTGFSEIIGVGRLDKTPGTNDAELGIIISDSAQGKGLGAAIVRRLVEVSKGENIRRITADILTENMAMQKICKSLGFKLQSEVGDPTVSAVLEIS